MNRIKKEGLKDKAQELASIAIKGSIGAGAALLGAPPEVAAVAVAAPFASELVNLFINPRRLQRVETMLSYLISERTGLTMDDVKEKMADPEFSDFMEDAMAEAAKSKTEERLRIIAQGLRDGIADSQTIRSSKRNLFIASQLTDDELATAILLSHSEMAWENDTWQPQSEVEEIANKCGLIIPDYAAAIRNQEVARTLMRLTQEMVLERIDPSPANAPYEDDASQIRYRFSLLGNEFFDLLRRSTQDIIQVDTEDDDTDYMADDFTFAE